MSEVDNKIQGLYDQYQSGRLESEHPTSQWPLIERIIRPLRRLNGNAERDRQSISKELIYQIECQLKDRPGHYPLTQLDYSSDRTGSGFEWGFDYSINGDVFPVRFWSYNRWGILVQRHPSDFAPEIEVVERTMEPTEEELMENPNDEPYTIIDRILHLPEGFKIPVGPLHFEGDNLPTGEQELAAERRRAIESAKAAGINVSEETLEIADKLSGQARTSIYRYFYWQPDLPSVPTKIAIDFDSIEPNRMGLTLENAPTFKNTLVINEEDW